MSRFAIQRIGITFLALVTIAVVIPIIVVIGVIVVQGLPAITAEFLFTAPRDGMRAGGIWPAIVGTFLLTVGTAIFSVP
jgi:phosphate transport system permease protein